MIRSLQSPRSLCWSQRLKRSPVQLVWLCKGPSQANRLLQRSINQPAQLDTIGSGQEKATKCCGGHKASAPSDPPLRRPESPQSLSFWTSNSTWHRASSNTLRCLLGCTLGDFSSMFYLQTHYAHLAPHIIMSLSMAAGIASSVLLETAVLRSWEGMTTQRAFRTAVGMSMISMVVMESVENGVDWWLTGGVVELGSAVFWGKAAFAMACGFGAALPYNYWRLRAFGKACH
ncbi:uncharacterized protein EV422DRAFT_362319 [Fimicolochytrium jonesii]|uniref:uncharacterized protein n=1 Tax=Fimicolochytrium jonesii TaxID=1396493 RepID=UPI0022FF3761|nr:uncharacterized protein EV422DRAFT_362319 [Fimicolochytrium jonesii]KAI8823618.1 hypothetical protein EV422DRAFT_362319 [Fimicolochytrium jonesii]